MQWRGVSRVMPCAADPEKFGGLGVGQELGVSGN